MKQLLKNATLLPEYGFGKAPVFIAVDGAKIVSVGTEEPKEKFENVIDCKGNLLLPGFYNAHCHAAMTLFRGYGEDLPLQRWLDEKILPAEDHLTAESVYVGTMWAIAEMLKNGIVSFSDMYMFEDATAKAVLDSGIKANVSRSIVSFDPDIDMEKDHRAKEGIQLVKDFNGLADGRLHADLSLHAEYTNVPKACAYYADFAKKNGLSIQLHLCETQHEVEGCLNRHEKTPVSFFNDLGVFDVPTSAAHCVYLTDEDIAILKEKKVTAVHNPVSNLKLGSGVASLQRLLQGGVNVALGTDGVASNNRLDLLREMQTAAILHKGVNRNPEATIAKDMVPLLTVNGAIAQNRPDCGKIEVGYRADMVLMNRFSIHNVPSFDDYAMLAYSAEASDVMMTMVDGRILYQNGEYTSIDEERLRYDFQKVLTHYFD